MGKKQDLIMRIVLDTNIICADFLMKGNAFRIFLSGVPRVGVTVYIPEVVVDEVLNKYKQALLEAVRSFDNVSKLWHRITENKLKLFEEALDIENQISWYREYLQEKIKNIGAKVVAYPDISHKEMVRRSLEGKPPFRSDGKGYRDSIIWQSILTLCSKDKGKIYFVTNNSRDFGEGPQLQNDLAQDLVRGGHPVDNVTVVSSLEKLNSELILPHLKRLDDMIDRFSRDAVSEFSLQGWVESNLKDELNDQEWGSSLLGIDPSHAHARVRINRIISVEVDDVRQLQSGDILLAATTGLEMEVDIDGDPEKYYQYDDVQAFWGAEPTDNSSALVPVTGKIAFTIMLEKKSLDVLSVEIDNIDSDFVTIQVNSHIRKPA